MYSGSLDSALSEHAELAHSSQIRGSSSPHTVLSQQRFLLQPCNRGLLQTLPLAPSLVARLIIRTKLHHDPPESYKGERDYTHDPPVLYGRKGTLPQNNYRKYTIGCILRVLTRRSRTDDWERKYLLGVRDLTLWQGDLRESASLLLEKLLETWRKRWCMSDRIEISELSSTNGGKRI